MLTVALVTTVVVLVAAAAGAAPPNRTSITVVCDRDAHSSAVVTLSDGPSGAVAAATTGVACGPDDSRVRIVASTSSAVGYASITDYEVSTGSATVTCQGEGTLPFRLACTDSSGAGTTIIVR